MNENSDLSQSSPETTGHSRSLLEGEPARAHATAPAELLQAAHSPFRLCPGGPAGRPSHSHSPHRSICHWLLSNRLCPVPAVPCGRPEAMTMLRATLRPPDSSPYAGHSSTWKQSCLLLGCQFHRAPGTQGRKGWAKPDQSPPVTSENLPRVQMYRCELKKERVATCPPYAHIQGALRGDGRYMEFLGSRLLRRSLTQSQPLVTATW